MAYIYKITNDFNGKLYIGKTELEPPERRFKEHCKDYKRERNEKRPLYAAMRKYGLEHFHFEVIEETNNPEEREIYWIDKLKTYVGFKDCNGYNATLGGDGKKYLNLDEQEVIDYHMSDAMSIISWTSKHFNVDAGTIKKILLKNNIGWLDLQNSIKYKTLLEEGWLVKIDPISYKIVGEYLSSKEASEENIDCKLSCLRKSKFHYYKGYYWCRTNYLPEEVKIANDLI